MGNDWYNLTTNAGRIAEELQTDPLGSTTLRRTSTERETNGDFARFENGFQTGTGRLLFSRRKPPTVPGSEFVQDSTGRAYDAGGNVTRGYQRVGQLADGLVSIGREVDTRNFYGADDRLRVLQKLDIRRASDGSVERAGVWEEYRYDPLGRRVLVRVRTDGNLCNYDAWACTASTTRFVWAGDQLLWELKEASGTYAAAAGGNVAYFHAGGIDRPLVITKNGESIVPHQNWRGQFARGTYADGAKVGQRSDCTSYPPSGCTPIQWPGERTTARHELEPDNRIQNWFGSLVDDMRDASGQMYRRNRYYDPQTGQFTQPDPIGLAGGLNAYGFAEGDAVSYDDPYGLSGCDEYTRKFAPWRCSLTYRTLTLLGVSEQRAEFWAQVGYGAAMASAGANTSMMGPAVRTLTGVQLNRAVGLRAEAAVARQLVAEGNTILASQVTIRTSVGRRVVDHIVQTPDGHLMAIEVKSGGAVRSGRQLAADHAIATEGGVIVGKNAPEALRGQTVAMPTQEWRVP